MPPFFMPVIISMPFIQKIAGIFTVLLLYLCLCTTIPACAGESSLAVGQTIYVPAYSHIYGGDKEQPFNLTVTLSLRNTDPDRPIRIMQVDYYDTEGHLIRRYTEKPHLLGPMASMRFVVSESDREGGSGANFLVIWGSDMPVNPPLVECIMIGTKMQQGISFTSRGQVILPHDSK